MSWLVRVGKGVVISLGFILPGVSGGVLAAILGLYERLLRFLAHLTRDTIKQVLFFLPVGIGGVLGLVLLSGPLEWLLDRWQVIVLWGFAGAIIGSLPALFRESTAKKPRDSADWAWLIGTALVGGVVLYLLPLMNASLPNNFAGFVIAGVLIALGVLVPGLSPSNLLLILGLFTPMLTGFREVNILGVFLPIALGAIAAILIFSRGMESLLDRFPSRVYHFIIGLVIASTVLIVVPTHSEEAIDYTGSTATTIVLAVVVFVAGLALGLWMARLEDKYKVAEVVEETASAIASTSD
ncbi:MAG: DUF368 domain-containing protein [Cellulomonadaceae bacterium]|jgi:putative membrane protein|nr:DUF368 domain-containing protein [Cellulomonadaceae bacterium]